MKSLHWKAHWNVLLRQKASRKLERLCNSLHLPAFYNDGGNTIFSAS